MLSIELPKEIEKKFIAVVQNSYDGNVKLAITSLLKLHKKYRWKEQLIDDVESIRSNTFRKGGIRAKDIEQAVKRYRKNTARSDA